MKGNGQPEPAETLWAFLAEMPDGRETIVGAYVPHLGQQWALVTVFEKNVEAMRPVAVAHKLATGQRIRLARYELREILEEF